MTDTRADDEAAIHVVLDDSYRAWAAGVADGTVAYYTADATATMTGSFRDSRGLRGPCVLGFGRGGLCPTPSSGPLATSPTPAPRSSPPPALDRPPPSPSTTTWSMPTPTEPYAPTTRRRQARLGRWTPIGYETIMTPRQQPLPDYRLSLYARQSPAGPILVEEEELLTLNWHCVGQNARLKSGSRFSSCRPMR